MGGGEGSGCDVWAAKGGVKGWVCRGFQWYVWSLIWGGGEWRQGGVCEHVCRGGSIQGGVKRGSSR